MLAKIFEEAFPETREKKKELLRKHRLAVWDVIHSCKIKGSSDSSIQDVIPNDLTEILNYSSIQKIICNGATSYKYYKKYQEKELGKEAISLPSTSPANATYSLERLVEIWKKELI
ncbi:DNA-deoxyinosine glycosylase [Fusobacterium necrophorum subsp. funduliforme]